MSDTDRGTEERSHAYLPDPECGVPGGGRGRRDEVGGSGVYPASAGSAPRGALPRKQGEWGRGERGPAAPQDSGPSEPCVYPAALEAEEAEDISEERVPDDAAGRGPGVESW